MRSEIIAVENRPFKELVGLDPLRKFFTPMELAGNTGIDELLSEFRHAQESDPKVQPSKMQRKALDARGAIATVMNIGMGQPLAIVPVGSSETLLRIGANAGAPGTQQPLAAFQAFGAAYATDNPADQPLADFIAALNASGQVDAKTVKAVRMEVFYNNHKPWLKTAVSYAFAIVTLGLSGIFWRKPLMAISIALITWGTIEQIIGLSLRIIILGRAPVSNTYESLLWMGLVAMSVAVVAQVVNRKGWYLLGGVAAAELCVLFANLVPLSDQTNALPAVLRSNYWLIVHVLVIVASYGVLALACVLGHAYLLKEVLFKKVADAPDQHHAHPLLIQTYRSIQIGVLLLTVGTILGGVWAADSWGRFWGWDPKETWALISIVIYFTMLHARYVGWLRDFGLAVCSIVGFMAIVWTFYGVNYVMAAGLHSYGFGAGGEIWVGLWALAEIVFLTVTKLKQRSLQKQQMAAAAEPAQSTPADPPVEPETA